MTIRQYRKKPVVVDAIRLTRDNVAEVESFINGKAREAMLPGPGRGITEGVSIHTLEGDMLAAWGDWIIKEPFPTSNRTFYPCKNEIFTATYEPVEGDL